MRLFASEAEKYAKKQDKQRNRQIRAQVTVQCY